MKGDILIHNGRIIDPARSVDSVGDVLIRGGRIAPLSELDSAGTQTLDAAGCIVVPGLIDFHAHLAHRMTDTGVNPDLMAIPNGITAAVDAGSAGAAMADAFAADIISRSELTVRAFLNVSSLGVATESYTENPDPALFDAAAIESVFERRPDHFLGLKIRLGRGFSDGLGLRSFRRAKEIAAGIRRPLCVHLTRSEFPVADLLDELAPGDILCHCFQGQGGHTILGADGRVLDAAHRARARGVIFDAATGRINHDYSVIAAAFADGFYPDVIATDVVATSMYDHKLFGLLYVISVFMAHGMSLPAALSRCTAAPARLMGMDGQIGTLAAGARADVAVFAVREKRMRLTDQYGHSVDADTLLLPQATLVGGRFLYKRIDFEY